MQQLARIVKAYDIRGLVPEELDVEVARALGRAAAVELQAPSIAVGRDMRPSSPELAEAFMAGARQEGVDTIDIGLASTDLLYYASGRLGVPGAMFTASHNPARYNGIKLCRAGAEPISLDTGLAEIRDRALRGDHPEAPKRGAHREVDLLAEFAEHVRGFADLGTMRPLKVAVDAGNGMAGHVVPPSSRACRSTSCRSTSSSTGPSRTTRRTRSSRRTSSISRRRSWPRAATSASPSTVTPTGCSASTSADEPSRPRSSPR
jgi:phosphomannomutase